MATIWQVQEDQGGRWRDFPGLLRQLAEHEYSEWVNSGKVGELVIEYNWPNSKRTISTPYEIHVKDEGDAIVMYQVNVGRQSQRRVRRVFVATA